MSYIFVFQLIWSFKLQTTFVNGSPIYLFSVGLSCQEPIILTISFVMSVDYLWLCQVTPACSLFPKLPQLYCSIAFPNFKISFSSSTEISVGISIGITLIYVWLWARWNLYSLILSICKHHLFLLLFLPAFSTFQ